jgi:hypothetical protein
MTVLGSNRPHAPITDMRINLMADRDRILAELANDIWTPEQRVDLIKELNKANAGLVHMQELASKKWKRRRVNAAINKQNRAGKGGRAKRLHDSHGQPLYNGVEPLVQEPEDSKAKFLDALRKTDESECDSQ